MNKYDNENILFIFQNLKILLFMHNLIILVIILKFKILVSINFIIKMFKNVIYIINILLLLLKKVIE